MISPRRPAVRALPATLLAAIVASSLTPLVATTTAHAADKQQCVAAYEDGQRLRKDGKLASARERLLVCAQDSCSSVLRRDCTQWVTEVEASSPTVVLEALGPDGHDLSDVRVFLDDRAFAERLDGKAIALDPGAHVVRFEARGASPVEERLVAREGDKNRLVRAQFGAPLATASTSTTKALTVTDAAPRHRPVPASTYALGTLGLVGLGTFAVAGVWGLAGKHDLDAMACKPDCRQGDVDRVKTRFLVADIGLGAGVVGLGLASIFFFTRGEAKPVPTTASTLRFDVTPAQGGARAGVVGTF